MILPSVNDRALELDSPRINRWIYWFGSKGIPGPVFITKLLYAQLVECTLMGMVGGNMAFGLIVGDKLRKPMDG